MKDWYRRKLPHWIPPEAVYFITFRLANSLPRQVIETLLMERKQRQQQHTPPGRNTPFKSKKLEEKYFEQFDKWLDRCITENPHWLAEPRIARIVAREIHRLDGERYGLIAYCIMPNHVHMLFHTVGYVPNLTHRGPTRAYPLTDTLRILKGRTARYCNQALGRTGAFWKHESYDRVVRDSKEFNNVLAYILNNPVKAGLVSEWKEWPFTWVSRLSK